MKDDNQLIKYENAADSAIAHVQTHAFSYTNQPIGIWAPLPQQELPHQPKPNSRLAGLAAWLTEAVVEKKQLAISLVLLFMVAGACLGAWCARYSATLTLGPVVPGKVPSELFSSMVALLQATDFSSSLTNTLPRGQGSPAITTIDGTDLIKITTFARTPAEASGMANRYAEKAIQFAADFDKTQKAAITKDLTEKLAATELALRQSHSRLLAFQESSGLIDAEKEITFRLEERAAMQSKAAGLRIEWEANLPQIENLTSEIPQLNPELVAVRERLENALAYYTEEHPKVKTLQAAVKALEERSATTNNFNVFPRSDNPVAISTYQQLLALRGKQAHLSSQIEETKKHNEALGSMLLNVSSNSLASSKLKADYETARAKYENLNASLLTANLALDASSPLFRVTGKAAPVDPTLVPLFKSVGLGAISSSAVGMLLAIGLCAFCKGSNQKVRSEADLHRATKLPVLASLGDLKSMTDDEQQQWALKALALLRGKLSSAYGNAIKCGFTSSQRGEGCSTWISLLSSAAARQGYRVLLVSADPASSNEPPSDSLGMVQVKQGLEIPCVEKPVMRISFPAPTWPLQRRKEWWSAVHQFAEVNDAALFVDLPPASDSESLFLANHLNNLIWLGAQDIADINTTRSHMKNFTSANCRFIGAVLNHGTAAARNMAQKLNALAIWMFLGSFVLCHSLAAADSPLPVQEDTSLTNSVGYISLSDPEQMSDWQKRLVLGPGDVLNISLADDGEQISARVTVGPDGRINFRNAQNIMATGLTVDELKVALRDALLKYIRSPGVVIIPQSYASKQYFILGSVAKPGPFLMDRSVTIVEAIAHAQGFTSGSRVGKSFLAADLSRSFLIRKDAETGFKRVPVDFEALFLHGDLTQNRPLQPQDYLYFAALDFPEVYVLGEVRSPGPTAISPDTTALKAIITRGGFTERAYKSRVLLVRGSLNKPTTFILNTSDVLAARSPDFRLQPKDIIYVNQKPWAKAEELLEMAISDFLRAAVITSAGREVSPLITQPIY